MLLLREADPRIAALLDQGYRFFTNAFLLDQRPPGLPVRNSDQVVAQLRSEGWEVELARAFDERGRPLPQMASVWRRRK